MEVRLIQVEKDGILKLINPFMVQKKNKKICKNRTKTETKYSTLWQYISYPIIKIKQEDFFNKFFNCEPTTLDIMNAYQDLGFNVSIILRELNESEESSQYISNKNKASFFIDKKINYVREYGPTLIAKIITSIGIIISVFFLAK